jgi:hypothetical protein
LRLKALIAKVAEKTAAQSETAPTQEYAIPKVTSSDANFPLDSDHAPD